MNRAAPVIAIVVPCFNEAEALPVSVPAITEQLDAMARQGIASEHSYVLCVDDGSTDATWQVIAQLHHADPRVRAIALAHNEGHQHALLAGLMHARGTCDAAISIDADMQDDPAAIPEMVEQMRQGADVVYAVRSERKADTVFKRSSAHAFYRFQRSMGLDPVYDHADYRLLDAKALDILSQYGESNLYLRGIVTQIGLRTATVSYQRRERVAGKSKYPLSKMLSFSVDGITSFSSRPIRYIFLLGVAFILIDIAVALYVLLSYFRGNVAPGWASIMLSIWFVGGVVLMGLGIVGEYIGKIYIEVKHRPRFSISDEIK